jgi:hypothetical protein
MNESNISPTNPSSFLVLRYFEWVLRGEGTEPLLLRKNREDIEYGTQELRNEW